MRLGEALALQWLDIDFERSLIEVQRTLSAGRIELPKNGKRRLVDMSLQLVAVLGEHLQTKQGEVLRANWKEFSGWVFTNTVGGPLDHNNLRERVFYPALDQAGVRKVRIHDLRHTYASLLIQNGESLAYIRDQLGHHSIQMTGDTYGHLTCGSNRKAVDRLDD